MATRIPLTNNWGNFGDSFLKGATVGGNLLHQAMNPILQREKNKQLAEQFEKELALKKQTESRMGANTGIQRQIYEQQLLALKHKNDPMFKLQQFQNLINGLGQMQGRAQNKETQAQEMPSYLPSMPEAQQNEAQMPQENIPNINEHAVSPFENQNKNQNNALAGIDMDTLKRGLIYQAAGLKPPTSTQMKEPPEIKRANDLRDKLTLEKYKHEQKIADKHEDFALKNEKTKQDLVKKYENDLPVLEETLRSLQIMKKISGDPKNDDMFGHWYIGNDAAAARGTNPNIGTWQTHGLGPIVAAEGKMSARGNQLALKNAIATKPNLAQTRQVANATVDANIDLIQRQIDHAKKIAGRTTIRNKKTGQTETVTLEEARRRGVPNV